MSSKKNKVEEPKIMKTPQAQPTREQILQMQEDSGTTAEQTIKIAHDNSLPKLPETPKHAKPSEVKVDGQTFRQATVEDYKTGLEYHVYDPHTDKYTPAAKQTTMLQEATNFFNEVQRNQAFIAVAAPKKSSAKGSKTSATSKADKDKASGSGKEFVGKKLTAEGRETEAASNEQLGEMYKQDEAEGKPSV